MTIHNRDIAAMFEEIADLLELQGANMFRVRAYRAAAFNLNSLPQEVSDMVKNNEDLHTIPGIGEDLALKIKQALSMGKLPALEKLKK